MNAKIAAAVVAAAAIAAGTVGATAPPATAAPAPTAVAVAVQWMGHGRDLISESETPGTWNLPSIDSGARQQPDAVFRLTVFGGVRGAITRLTLRDDVVALSDDVVAPVGRCVVRAWDTVPGNGIWALGVTTPGSQTLLNAPDSSVALKYNGNRVALDLYASDDNAVWPCFYEGEHITVEAVVTGAKGGTSVANTTITLPNRLD